MKVIEGGEGGEGGEGYIRKIVRFDPPPPLFHSSKAKKVVRLRQG